MAICSTVKTRTISVDLEERGELDLTCPIAQQTMNKVMTLMCGHSFNARHLSEWLRRQETCPTCREPVVILPDEAVIARMVELQSLRSTLQQACDVHLESHPEEQEDDLGAPPTPPNTPIPIEYYSTDDLLPPGAPHIVLDVDHTTVPSYLGLRTFVHYEGSDTTHQIRLPRDDIRYQHGIRINPNPRLPTRIAIRLEFDSDRLMRHCLSAKLATGILAMSLFLTTAYFQNFF